MRVGIDSAAAAGARTITNAYGVYIANVANAGTITNNYGIYQVASGAKNYFAGNVGIGTSNLGTGGSRALVLGNGALPTAASGAGLYAKAISGTTQLFVFDGAGNDKQISSHAMDAPQWMYDADDGVPMIVKETQHFLGYVRYTNQTRQARLVSMTDAEKSNLTLQARTCVYKESFADHNARLGLTGGDALVARDWDTDQRAIKSARDAERLAAIKAKAEQQAARTTAVARTAGTGGEPIRPDADIEVPEEYIIQEMPALLRAGLDAANR